MAYALLDAPANTCKAAGISREDALASWECTARGDLAGAARLINDEVLGNSVIAGPQTRAVAELAGLAAKHQVDELTSSFHRGDLVSQVQRVAPVLIEAARTPVMAAGA